MVEILVLEIRISQNTSIYSQYVSWQLVSTIYSHHQANTEPYHYTDCYLHKYSYDFSQYVNSFMVSFTFMLLMLFCWILLYILLFYAIFFIL